MYSNDPLVYGARVHNISYCTCYSDKLKGEIRINQTEITYFVRGGTTVKDYKINYSNFLEVLE